MKPPSLPEPFITNLQLLFPLQNSISPMSHPKFEQQAQNLDPINDLTLLDLYACFALSNSHYSDPEMRAREAFATAKAMTRVRAEYIE
jgi:hypothetical protein